MGFGRIEVKNVMHLKSDSDDGASYPPSPPPRSQKPAVYYVQSPSSRDSHDEDKSSSSTHAATTPATNTPMESPTHPSCSRHSRSSASSRVSGPYPKVVGGGWRNTKRIINDHLNNNNKDNNIIIEEEDMFYYIDMHNNKGASRILIGLLGVVFVSFVFCFIVWGSSRPFKPQIIVKSVSVHNFNLGQGSDLTGVPTKMITMNCSVKMNVYNPATFFSIHLSFMPVHLLYSQVVVATGELKRYIPRKSHKIVHVNVEGVRVPLYGAGPSLSISDIHNNGGGGGVPFTLAFHVRSQGYLVGNLVKSRHTTHVSCSLFIDYRTNKPIHFNENSCAHQ